jgi:predicted metal-binding membrane protein
MVAVMTPLIAANVKYAALRSARRTRFGVGLAVTTGWASIWLVPAIAIAMVSWLAMVALGTVASIAVVTVVAVGWQWTEAKRLSLARCHRVFAPPLSPGRARAASRGYGRDIGRSCVVSCMPFMALMAVSGHSIVVAVPLAGTAWYERWRRPHHDPARRLTSATLAAVGIVAAAIATLSLG